MGDRVQMLGLCRFSYLRGSERFQNEKHGSLRHVGGAFRAGRLAYPVLLFSSIFSFGAARAEPTCPISRWLC